MEEATQPTQAATQAATQVDSGTDEADVWGFLLPCNSLNPNAPRVKLHYSKLQYTVGRGLTNDVVFMRGITISSKHCTIEWDGDVTSSSAVKVTDYSMNGTWINGENIGKGKSRLLHDGNEIAFGSTIPQPPERAVHDYRYIFRRRTAASASTGLESLYDLQHVLGRGSFATVVKALHKTEGGWYAVKIIQASKLKKSGEASKPLDEGEDPMDNIPAAFRREIEILRRLSHRNICKLKEVFFESTSISLVLEWVKGGDLLSYIESRPGGIPELLTQNLTYQICDALAYIHGLGITHRDLKPENILLTDDNPPVLKIADFGLAKVVNTLTVLHTFCGTPAYLAPEVVTAVDHNEGYDQLVDSWSVGVIVFCMIAECTPFNEDSVNVDLKTQIANRQVEWTVLQSYHVSEECEEFIRALLQHDPKKRMTLTDACKHPWLAVQIEAAATRAAAEAAAATTKETAAPAAKASSSSAPGPAPVAVPLPPKWGEEPPPSPRLARARSPLADTSILSASMRSDVSASMMSLDTGSFAMAVVPPSQDISSEPSSPGSPSDAGASLYLPGISDSGRAPPNTTKGEDDGGNQSPPRPTTPPARASSPLSIAGRASPGGRVQRRADVLRRAHAEGVELPEPSQEMHAWAAAAADAVTPEGLPVEKPVAPVHVADVAHSKPKRKAADMSSEGESEGEGKSDPRTGRSGEPTQEEDGSQEGGAKRARKKIRTGESAMDVGTGQADG